MAETRGSRFRRRCDAAGVVGGSGKDQATFFGKIFMRYGYFDGSNREYVIERVDVPVSWTNYLGVEDLCTVISHNAGGYSFYRSAETGRITRFRANAIPLDRPGHYVYLRDDDTGDYWSVSWQPAGKELSKARYECRHGLSYSKFRCRYNSIDAEQRMFVPLGDDVELWDVRIKNTSKRKRKLSVFSYVEFSLHNVRLDSQDFQMGLYASGSSYENGVIDYDFFYGPGVNHFMAASFTPDSYDCVRDVFIGNYRTETNPTAVEKGKCSNSSSLGGNHCGALHKSLVLGQGEEKRVVFMLGVGSGKNQGQKVKTKYSKVANVDKAFAGLRKYWDEKLSVLQVKTPDKGINTMLNIWNLYQAETCIVWSRFVSFIEVGGRSGLGYRDTAQDAMSTVHANPEKSRQRICELLHGQAKEGFGLHLFEPELFGGQKKQDGTIPTVTMGAEAGGIKIPTLKDVCADDFLWLVVTVCEYVKETGRFDFFDEIVPFADGGEATVYEHLKRGLDFSGKHVGAEGICKGLRADWNDCINLKGGQSAMVSFIFYWALNAFVEAAEFLGRIADVRKYKKLMEKTKTACEKKLWDGGWYIRGITADGRKMGSRRSREGKIFLNAQSWAVMSGAVDKRRGVKCMDAVDEHLYTNYGLSLLWPAYTRPDDSIGFVTRVYPGIKENASIFSHPNPWAIIAECMLGRGERAYKFYSAMLPYNQNDIIQIRRAEPYSYCQFIMGKDHAEHGKANHPWLTGSAGWFYIAATQWMLGVRAGYDGMVIDPCIPGKWSGFKMVRKWRDATYNITVKNPKHVQKGVKKILLNKTEIQMPIPVQKGGTINEVIIEMG